MPSLNFPTSPTLGQQYNDWVWNGGQWDFRQTLPGGLPAGAIIQWGGSTAPVNWLLCDGSAVSRTTYASLFAAVGTSYGAGDGTTTFNLPDLRGRVPVGKNGGSFGTLGATGGAETHTLTVAQLPAVTGDFRLHGGENGSAIWQPNGVFSSSDIRSGEYRTSSASQPGASSVGPILRFNNGGQGQAHNNLQPYQVVNYIIKATAAVTPGESELAPRVGVLEAVNSGSRLTSVEARATALELADSTTNKSGLVPIIPTSITTGGTGSVSASGVVSFNASGIISLNGIFTTDFVEYKIFGRWVADADRGYGWRWRANGTDKTDAFYHHTQIWNGGGSVGTSNGQNNTFHGYSLGHRFVAFEGTFTGGKQTTLVKTMNATYNGLNSATTQNEMHFSNGVMRESGYSADGITMFCSAGNMTGHLQVFGVRR